MRKITILLLLIISNNLQAQVYNYLPISLSNIETNPTFVASMQNKIFVSAAHINNFQENENFSFNTVRISKYFEDYFCGVGLILSNVNTFDSIKYNYIGISAAYRNILFDKVHAKIGVNYKLLDINAPKGNFSKYSYDFEDSIMTKSTRQNLNLSFTLSSPNEFYYVTYGMLNLSPSFLGNDKNLSEFPSYNYLRFGNFWNFRDPGAVGDISILFVKESVKSYNSPISYYLTIWDRKTLTRRGLILKYGADIGYVKNSYFNFRPSISLYRDAGHWNKNVSRRKRGGIAFKFLMDIGSKSNSVNEIYKSAYQFSIMYNI